jgi:hypothetical protein
LINLSSLLAVSHFVRSTDFVQKGYSLYWRRSIYKTFFENQHSCLHFSHFEGFEMNDRRRKWMEFFHILITHKRRKDYRCFFLYWDRFNLYIFIDSVIIYTDSKERITSIKILSFLFPIIICTAAQTINVKISFTITCSLSNKYNEESKQKLINLS